VGIFHGAGAPSPQEDVSALFRATHARIKDETESVRQSYRKTIQDIVVRESQMLRGALSQFIETPIRSDNAEVMKIFTESFERFQEQLIGGLLQSQFYSSEGRVIVPPAGAGAEAKPLQNGRKFLQEIGVRSHREKGETYESVYYLSGGFWLDVFESIVHDGALGQSSGPPGELFDPVRSALIMTNVIFRRGDPPSGDKREGCREVVLFFSPPAGKTETRQDLEDLWNGVFEELKPLSLTVGRQRLGTGRGAEFTCRCIAADLALPEAFLESLKRRCTQESGRAWMLSDGKLLLKEILF
jgi:hypothetical protein